MKLEVEKRSGKHLCSIEVPDGATLDDLKIAFDETSHYYPERQRWTIADTGIPLTDGKLADQGIRSGATLQFKDLGVQISWRLVFVLEYIGPIFIAPLLYFQSSQRTMTQHVALGLIIFHFIKRELETLFIHRFSHGTMPLVRLPINCFHYWVLCALAISYYLFHPKYKGPFDQAYASSGLVTNSTSQTIAIHLLAAAMLIFEFLNFKTHVILRNLRPRNSKTRAIPYGWGFDMVSCANYFWEICAWATFSVLVGCLTSWLFLAVAVFQMTEWALKKHKNYIKEFKQYPKTRQAIFPLLL